MPKNGLDYELLDFGGGRKLERFGKIILDRPDVLANQRCKMPSSYWESEAHGRYNDSDKKTGEWMNLNGLPEVWTSEYQGKFGKIVLELKPGKFKHPGVFPEQEKHWRFLEKSIKPGQRMLNLFGYTGMASLVAAKAGADVFHNDSSKSIIKQAVQNAEKSGITNIHWVCEDALKFALREEKRNHKYDFIIMDPPVYGRGKNGERWKIEELLPQLVKTTASLLNNGGYLILNTYSPQILLENMIAEMAFNKLKCIDSGWLGIKAKDGRLLNLSKYTLAKK